MGKLVTWKKGEAADCDEELFPRKEVGVSDHPRVSLLSKKLEEQKEEDRNPWQEYARWEGTHFPESQVNTQLLFLFVPFQIVGEESGGVSSVSR